MMNQSSNTDLGPPDLKVVGFQLWVHGRQFPEAETAFDRNWLRVSAHCSAANASVWAHGPIVMVSNIANFGASCHAMHRFESRTAVLDSYEPNLKIRLEATDSAGHIRATVEITPDHLAQQHLFQFDADQSYLPEIIRQCRRIVKKHSNGQDEV